jgi:hypothetical protein
MSSDETTEHDTITEKHCRVTARRYAPLCGRFRGVLPTCRTERFDSCSRACTAAAADELFALARERARVHAALAGPGEASPVHACGSGAAAPVGSSASPPDQVRKGWWKRRRLRIVCSRLAHLRAAAQAPCTATRVPFAATGARHAPLCAQPPTSLCSSRASRCFAGSQAPHAPLTPWAGAAVCWPATHFRASLCAAGRRPALLSPASPPRVLSAALYSSAAVTPPRWVPCGRA